MSIPNMQWVIEETRAKYPRAWDHCHVGGDPEALDFIILAAREMSVHDNTNNGYGMNAKRGNMGDPSMDVIYAIDRSGTDGVFDVIGSAGSPSAAPAWNYIGPGENATSGYIDPWTWQTHYNYTGGGGDSGGTTPAPVPPAAPVWPSYESLGGDEGAKQITRVLEADYKSAGRPGLDGECGGWLRRTDYDAMTGVCASVEDSIAKHRAEWLAELGLPANQPLPEV